jgi:putative FmdB family regulatory protein
MPIYEFYCADCNTMFNFFSYRINTDKRPLCPHCKKGPLDRVISTFAVLRGTKEEGDSGMPDIDETKMEKALSIMEHEAQNMNEDDPQQAAQLMRKVCDAAGMDLGSGMEEALRRMESGENPDKIEEDLGDLLNREDLLKKTSRASQKMQKKPPRRDEKLYYL